MTGTVFVAALLVLLAIVVGALYRQRRLNEHLRAQLEAAAADLQHLQEACSRLAPAGVVQRLSPMACSVGDRRHRRAQGW